QPRAGDQHQRPDDAGGLVGRQRHDPGGNDRADAPRHRLSADRGAGERHAAPHGDLDVSRQKRDYAHQQRADEEAAETAFGHDAPAPQPERHDRLGGAALLHDEQYQRDNADTKRRHDDGGSQILQLNDGHQDRTDADDQQQRAEDVDLVSPHFDLFRQ